MRRLSVFLLWLCLSAGAHAHKPSDSYLKLKVEGDTILGQWDIALRDLDFALGLDANGDAEITWGEVRDKHREIESYALSRLQLSTGGQPCAARAEEHLVDDHTDGAYAVLRFAARCPMPVETLQARYSLFFDLDPQHKGLLRLEQAGATRTAIFAPEKPTQDFVLGETDKLGQLGAYLAEGVWHIWIGFDHILFLLALLLPSVLRRESAGWRPVASFRPAFWSVVKIVTAFTIAHSITLSLATLGIISLPSRWVETTIAVSVVIAALNNLFPLFPERRWLMAFLFGLIHGFGFATVLGDLGLPTDALLLALVGFNLGVEAGQLAIVGLFLPVAFWLRHTALYRYGLLVGGSVLIALLALVWALERGLDLKLLPF